MRRMLAILTAVSLLSAAPVLAQEVRHGQMNDQNLAKECTMLLNDCGHQVDSIQEKIKKLQARINEQGPNAYTQEELKILKRKLHEANETLRLLNKP